MTKPFKPLKEYGYTPKLSMDATRLLRRLAWFHKKPMSKTLEDLALRTCGQYRLSKVCK